MTARCSIALVTRPSRSSRRAFKAPRSARLSDSAAPPVNTTPPGSALIAAARSACAPPGADLSATGSPAAIAPLAPSASPSLTTSPAATTSPFAEAAAGTEWPAVVVYTVTADGVAHRIDRTGTTDLPRICDGQPVGAIARADGGALLVRCDAVPSDEDAMAV